MPQRVIATADLDHRVRVEVRLDEAERTVSWTVFRDDAPFLRWPQPGQDWRAYGDWSETQTAAVLLANALSCYATEASIGA